jgi:hypothetical protein
MVDGRDIPEFGETFGVDAKRTNFDIDAYLIKSSVQGNILWPDDSLTLTIQLKSKVGTPLEIKGVLEVISYGTKGRPGDIWVPQMFKISEIQKLPFNISLKEGGFLNISLHPRIPQSFGAYGFVLDLGEYGRQFITSCVRTFSFPKERIQYPSFCLDDNSNDVLQRLGVHAIRHGIEYKPTDDPDFDAWYEEERQRMMEYQKSDIAVLVKMGAPSALGRIHPLGMSRPWLNDQGIMQNTKTDMAWLPQYDDDFKKLVYKLAVEFGWPKGPVNAFALWNEPWEGISISGWGADIQRYREIYTKMAEAVEEARRDAGVDVLVGGCSSTSNALDKLFADGDDTFLDRFDFCSIHYQGMSPSATIKKWADRKSPRGRVRIWDTESWVANVDDRVAAVVATNRSAGYDRAMGIFFGNIAHVNHHPFYNESGDVAHAEIVHAWSVAASVGAAQHFIGERTFRELLFKKGLPWISVFNGLHANDDDGTLVVVGDIGEEFGPDNLLFRTARGLQELQDKKALKEQLQRLNPVKDAEKIKKLKAEIEKPQILTNATLAFPDAAGRFLAFDFYGNPLPSAHGHIVVPLDGRGFFLRTNGSLGSFADLLEAVRNSDIRGIEPLETIAFDFKESLDKHPFLQLKLTNVLNRTVKGQLKLNVGHVALKSSAMILSFQPHETKILSIPVKKAELVPDNRYLLKLEFDAGQDGTAVHEELLHVNVIPKRKIKVDGNLEDWKGSLPQVIEGNDQQSISLTEAAWFPFKSFGSSIKGGLATGYMAYDEQYFYFAAKVADESMDEGMRRFETLDSDEFFYPEKSFIPYNGFRFGGAMKQYGVSFSARWTGTLRPDATEEYTLYLPCEGQARLWLDGELIIDQWLQHQQQQKKIRLIKNNLYNIKVEFAKEWGRAAIALQWESAHHAKGTIPSQYLFQTSDKNTGSGLIAHYYNGPQFNSLRASRLDATIDFHWSDHDTPDDKFRETPLISLQWPEGVRRYSYRKDTETPSGNFSDHDNVQIAFNVLDDEDKELYPFPPGTMKGYVNYQCTDYEYALNPVAEMYGGGVEIWRMKVPGMPHKHFFPRQMPSPFDGPVKNGLLKIMRQDGTRIIEAAIPWEEIPHVKQRLDKKQTIKFSFRINDNTPHGCMELAYRRSVSKINGSFKVDWKEHWANEVEFAFE